MKKYAQKLKGFTLVELAIVFVIIGLLIGGILAAQSMISTAKINRVIKDVSQYEVATQNFQTKFGQLPGDNNFFPSQVSCGSGQHGDGQVDYCEMQTVWNHLSLGVGLKNSLGLDYSQSPQNQVGNMVPVTNCPVLSLDQSNGGSCLILNNLYTSPKNAFSYISSNKFTSISTTPVNPLRPVDALAIDTKIDDGIANTGKVTDIFSITNQYDQFSFSFMDANCSSNGAYSISQPFPAGCSLNFDPNIFTGGN